MDVRSLKKFYLPTLLVALLVVETLLFNWWLGIGSLQFFLSCIAATVGLGAVLFLPAVFFSRRALRHLYLFFVSLAVAAIFLSQ